MTLQLLRGRVMIRPIVERQIGSIILPDQVIGARDNKNSLGMGIVIDMGPPALTPRKRMSGRWVGGVEIPPQFKIGDKVLHVGQHKSRDAVHPETGEVVRMCSQEEVQAVIE